MIHDEIDCAEIIDNHLKEVSRIVCENNISKYVVIEDLIYMFAQAQSKVNLSKRMAQ